MSERSEECERKREQAKAAAERMLEPRYSYHPELDERHIKHMSPE